MASLPHIFSVAVKITTGLDIWKLWFHFWRNLHFFFTTYQISKQPQSVMVGVKQLYWVVHLVSLLCVDGMQMLWMSHRKTMYICLYWL